MEYLLWFLALALGFIVFFVLSGHKLQFNSSNLFILSFVLQMHIPAYLYFYDNKRFVLFTSLTLLSFCMGTIYVTLIYKFTNMGSLKSKLNRFKRMEVIDDIVGNKRVNFYIILLVVLVFSVIYLALALKNAHGLAILKAFSSLEDFKEARQKFTKVPGAGYLYQFYGVLLPISTGILFVKSFINQRFKIYFWILFFLTIFILVACGSRKPLLLFLLFVFLIKSYVDINISYKKYIFGALAIFVVFVFLTYIKFYATGVSFNQAIEFSLRRIFLIQALGPEFLVNYIPFYQNYFHGKTLLIDLKGLLPGVQKGFSSILPELRGKASHNNPIGIYGDFYINWGFLGVVIAMFIYGLLSQYMYIKFISFRQKTISQIVVYNWIMLILGVQSTASLIGLIFQFGIFSSVLFFFILKIKLY